MRTVFLGPPGVGKGTYASRIGPKLGIPHISTGDLVRGELRKNSGLGLKMKKYYEGGLLVPDGIIMEALVERLKKNDCKGGFVLEGFPRNIEQAEELDRTAKMDIVINLVLADDILVEKISARRICRKCGNIYNIVHIRRGDIDMPPILPKREGICDKCGGELYQRRDDRPEIMRERFKVYREETEPLIEYYRKKSILRDVHVIGGPEKMVPIIMGVLKQ
jgi:adenylate kinase